MFTMSDLASLNHHQTSSKLLKPWWEVFMDYLVVLMLMVSVLAGTVLLSRDRVVCLPLDPIITANTTDHIASTSSHVALTPSSKPSIDIPYNIRPNPPSAARGRRTHLVYQQYVYISQVCYHEALPWFSRFFPYIALLQSVVLLASGSFWFHFPQTSARIEHFLTILANSQGHASPSSPLLIVDNPRQVIRLDKNDGEQARALFERVRRFRTHCESSDVIYKVYLAQTIFKLLMVTLIVSYSIPCLNSISFIHTCHPEEHALVGYSTFECTHVLASLLHKLLVAYLTLLGLYGLLNFYTLSWILHSSLRQYSFHMLKELCSLRDVPDLNNDLAFLLHMSDQYDPLLAQRLSVFLSPVSESRLLEESLEKRWGEEKLHSMTSLDAEGRSRLQLVALPHLPPALFSLVQLQVLKLEFIANARFTAQVANMTSLRELHLYHCTVAVDPAALGVLQERLEALHLTFTQVAEIPSWIFSLRGLNELHLTGRLGNEGGVARSWGLGSLRQLCHLRVLVIRGMLQRVPGELCEVAGSLVRLEIQNEGTRLLVLTGLKRMFGLTELQLQDCQLERLPSVLLSLANLRSLDLRHNNLRTLEELLSLAHLQHLSCLRLAYNCVLALPASVSVLRGLEFLDLANNHLQNLPPALFTLHHLRRLLLAGNLLEELPAEIKALHLLTELDLSGNKLESLPPELFSNCLELRILNVAHNSISLLPRGLAALGHLFRFDLRNNNLEELPAELGCCSGLRGGGLLVENWLFRSLPSHVRDFLTNPCATSGTCSERSSRPESDSFPYFSPSQWSFTSALESQI
ncbi:hypothetical protein LDENG_00017630 [Lucifuga dentata]|nr:hypothetical protein LDENG_00017630 [Lucifuga dentata]